MGKVRLALAPLVNHWWEVPLYVTVRGLTTSPIPYQSRYFQIDFDFLSQELRIERDDGRRHSLPLKPQTVAAFYRDVMDALHSLDIDVRIWPVPVEVSDPVPFKQNETLQTYDPEQAERFWRVLVQVDRVFTAFRARFLGKVSPVHLFWGGLDLAVTRFSGRAAPKHLPTAGIADHVVQEAYSRECSSAGFWPGAGLGYPAFYSYAYPEPAGYAARPVQPAEAFYHADLHEFILPYEAVRRTPSPDEVLLAFLQSTYEAAADLGGWDRPLLERQPDRVH